MQRKSPFSPPLGKGEKKIKKFLIPLFIKEGSGEILKKNKSPFNPPLEKGEKKIKNFFMPILRGQGRFNARKQREKSPFVPL